MLSVSNSFRRFRARMAEVDGAIWAECARWGRGEFSKQSWSNACSKCMNSFIAKRNGQLKGYYVAEGWYPSISRPEILVPREVCQMGDVVRLTASEGLKVYWTDDGSDPAESADAMVSEDNAGVYLVGGESKVVKARAYCPDTGEWSLMATATVASDGTSSMFESDEAVVTLMRTAVDPDLASNVTTVAEAVRLAHWASRRGLTLEGVLAAENSYVSFVLDATGLIAPEVMRGLGAGDVSVNGVAFASGGAEGLSVAVGVRDLPVGSQAERGRLGEFFVFGGCFEWGEEFLQSNVAVDGDPRPDGKGGAVFTVRPCDSEADRSALFVRAWFRH